MVESLADDCNKIRFIMESLHGHAVREIFSNQDSTFAIYVSVHEFTYSFTYNRTLYLNRPRLKMSKRNQNINKRARCIAVDKESSRSCMKVTL